MTKNRKIGFIGIGNLGQAIVKALLESKTFEASQIFATNRSPGKLAKMHEQFGIGICKTNEELVEKCDTIVLAVKPQDLALVLEPIASTFSNAHLVISLAAGFSIKTLNKLLPEVSGLVRVMPNTPSVIRKAVVGYCLGPKAKAYESQVIEIFQPLGLLVPTPEGEAFEAVTVSCGSGTGFVLELMQYWQEWLEEHNFEPQLAREMVVQTFLGAALMAEKTPETSLADLQDKVVSKKGVTFAGLQSLRELEVERALRYSFEKAVLRDQEIARSTEQQ